MEELGALASTHAHGCESRSKTISAARVTNTNTLTPPPPPPHRNPTPNLAGGEALGSLHELRKADAPQTRPRPHGEAALRRLHRLNPGRRRRGSPPSESPTPTPPPPYSSLRHRNEMGKRRRQSDKRERTPKFKTVEKTGQNEKTKETRTGPANPWITEQRS
jgi:hypothetical protein